jgi:hypothetical protein
MTFRVSIWTKTDSEPGPGTDYLKLGFGGEHTESNQRLMYTSAWASPQ